MCNNTAKRSVAKKDVAEYLNNGSAKEFFKTMQ